MKPEGCPSCRVTLVWMRAKPPAWLGFCEGCGAYWLHQPGIGTEDVSDACYAGMAPGLSPTVDVAQFRADDLRGRTMRAFAAQRLRQGDAPAYRAVKGMGRSGTWLVLRGEEFVAWFPSRVEAEAEAVRLNT